jgi:hypothetical protein
MTDSSPGWPGWTRGGWRRGVLACAAFALSALPAMAGEPPAPWEIQGYPQTPAWQGADRAPGAARSVDAPTPWVDSGTWQNPPGQWSGRDRALDPSSREDPNPWVPSQGPQGGGRDPHRLPADTYSPERASDWGYAQDPVNSFGSDRTPSGRWEGQRDMSHGSAGAVSPGAYPSYRFRGDPEPVASPWSSQPGGDDYRFRPLTDGELNRRGRGSVWHPGGPRTEPQWGESRGPEADRGYAPGPAYGFEPNPWQVR